MACVCVRAGFHPELTKLVARRRGGVFKPMTGDSLAFTQAKEITMSDPTDVQNSIERMKICMELRGHRPTTGG